MVKHFHPLHRPPSLGDGDGRCSLHEIRVPEKGEKKGEGRGEGEGEEDEEKEEEGRRGGTLIR